MVARLLWEQDAAGSSPVTSTKQTGGLEPLRRLLPLRKQFCELFLGKRGECFLHEPGGFLEIRVESCHFDQINGRTRTSPEAFAVKKTVQ